MSSQAVVQQAVLSKRDLVGWLAHYLEQQPESVRATDKLLKRIEVSSLFLPVVALVAAVVLIATRSTNLSESIPAAIFGVWGCCAVWILLLGLHSIAIRAFPPVPYLMASQTKTRPGFYTGNTAVGMGVFIILSALVFGACCAMGAFAFFDQGILKVLIPIIIVYSVGSGLCGTWIRKQRMS